MASVDAEIPSFNNTFNNNAPCLPQIKEKCINPFEAPEKPSPFQAKQDEELEENDENLLPGSPFDKPYREESICLRAGYFLGMKIGGGDCFRIRMAGVVEEKIAYDAAVARLVESNGHDMVAVKIINVLSCPFEFDEDFVATEIQALHSLHGHPNIVELYDVFECNNHLFIVTELCPKGNLLRFIKFHSGSERNVQGLPESLARHFFIQMCEAMQYCHDRGIVHRDFNCNSVLICSDEETIKIANFGFVCKDIRIQEVTLTPCEWSCKATPQVLLSDTCDPFEFDIWCLGVVLFHMLNGAKPCADIKPSLMRTYLKTHRLQFSNISQEAKLLIRDILLFDPRKRPRIKDIMNSEWVRGANLQKKEIVRRESVPVQGRFSLLNAVAVEADRKSDKIASLAKIRVGDYQTERIVAQRRQNCRAKASLILDKPIRNYQMCCNEHRNTHASTISSRPWLKSKGYDLFSTAKRTNSKLTQQAFSLSYQQRNPPPPIAPGLKLETLKRPNLPKTVPDLFQLSAPPPISAPTDQAIIKR